MKRPNKRHFLYAVIVAVLIKLSLFAFAEIHAPGSKIMPDSPRYLETAAMMASDGVFATKNEGGGFTYESLRTPGYPLALAILNNKMKIPLSGVVFMQISLTIFAAWIIYKTAGSINPGIAFLATVIFLYDPPITIFSQMIITEALFLFLITLFMFEFTRYLKCRTIGAALSAALVLVAATYVRPIAYYIAAAVAVFIVYANMKENLKRGVIHAVIFFTVVYSLLGIWQVRNYVRCGDSAFSGISHMNAAGVGLVGSYVRNADPATKGMAPAPYYINVTSRCLMSLMTRPGSLKYFRSNILTAVGKVLAYPWMVFWLTGFIVGIAAVRRNLYLQLYMLIILYFTAASIINIMWLVGERFRVPMMPFIAIISAYGWVNLISMINSRFSIRHSKG